MNDSIVASSAIVTSTTSTEPAETVSRKPLSVGFIGSGMMASAIMEGLVTKHVVSSASDIWCSDVWEPARNEATNKGYHVSTSNVEVCQHAHDAIILAVKPDIITKVCTDVIAAKGNSLVISVAAGITISTLEQHLPGRRVIRIMPNTACVVGEAACGYTLGTLALESDKEIVQQIFGSVGIAHEFKEVLLNAVTGLSGSGPAYVFCFIEALADGGVRAGLPRHEAIQLAAQTVKGAAEMVLSSQRHPGELKDQVCSPGGTTIAGVDELEKGCVFLFCLIMFICSTP
jgi:pyrroline-5-carboxylate reductase